MKSIAVFFLLMLTVCVQMQAQQAQNNELKYTSDGQFMKPENYREWIYLSSGLGMTYGLVERAANAVMGDRFDNVFVNPQAYKAFLATGTWPDKTVFAMEVRSSSSKGSINKGGELSG